MAKDNSKSYEQIVKERQQSLTRQVRHYFLDMNKNHKDLSNTEVLNDLNKRLQELQDNKTAFGLKVTEILRDLIKNKS